MAKKKVTQKEAIFYALYKHLREKPGEYIPVFNFMGEIYVKEVALWGFVSHECSARCSEMKKENPDLIQSTVIIAKSGARYFGYRLNPEPKRNMINDDSLRKLHAILIDRMQ